jgi:hypothetical protein
MAGVNAPYRFQYEHVAVNLMTEDESGIKSSNLQLGKGSCL